MARSSFRLTVHRCFCYQQLLGSCPLVWSGIVCNSMVISRNLEVWPIWKRWSNTTNERSKPLQAQYGHEHSILLNKVRLMILFYLYLSHSTLERITDRSFKPQNYTSQSIWTKKIEDGPKMLLVLSNSLWALNIDLGLESPQIDKHQMNVNIS